MSARAQYVAIIAGGSRRWADCRGLSLGEGYQAGADAVKARVADAMKLGITELTICLCPAENFSPPEEEATQLFAMFVERIASGAPALREHGARIRFIGHRTEMATDVIERMTWAEAETAANKRITLFIVFNYGSRTEIVDAARAFSASEEEFSAQLYAPDMHDPDLLIRTGGERRLSNSLLWQCAYSELVFRDELWPDFNQAALEKCLKDFDVRQRRFGARR